MQKMYQSNLVDHKCQQMSDVWYTFMPGKSYAYMLNVESGSLVFLKKHNTEFDEIIITFT